MTNMDNLQIRETDDGDLAGIQNTVSAAFGESAKEEQETTELVAKLLADPSARPYLSLAAFYAGEIV